MIIHGIHHIRFAVLNPSQVAKFFIERFKFIPYAVKTVKTEPSIVLKHQNVIFVLCKRLLCNNNNTKEDLANDNLEYHVDTVCDICFEAHFSSNLNAHKIIDENGYVQYKIVKSVVGNLQHTLIDTSNYKGTFLPGFEEVESKISIDTTFSTVDHIALAVKEGYTSKVLSWYKNTFEFERLFINENDSEKEGFVVQYGSMGMRLKAMQQRSDKCPLKFVIAESTSSAERQDDQIKEFLTSHNGMGVQHIGLGTNNLIKAVQNLSNNGANFITPPIEYYLDKEKEEQIFQLKLSMAILQNSGIMVESGKFLTNKKCNNNLELSEKWYIMQVFTRPIFSEKTFFLELIERHRTEAGFGAANIEALWKSLQSHMSKTVT